MKKEILLPLIWGILHGFNDFTAGFMLSNYMIQGNVHGYLLLVVYSILAFGGQLPAGLWLDKSRNIKGFAFTSIYLLLISIALFFVNPALAIIVNGIASAGIHVTGGSVCLMIHEDKAGPLGIFTAPGVIGLALGLLSGALNPLIIAIPAVGTMFCLGLVSRTLFPAYLQQGKKEAANQLDHHDWVMILLLLIMCLRSLVYDIINHFSGNMEEGMIIIALSAFAGKIIGGFTADKIGWKKWVYISLPVSFILLQLGKENIYMLAFGIAGLQSSVPISFMLMRKAIPLFPATATALSLGTSVALAGLPLYAMNQHVLTHSWFSTKWLWLGIAIISMLLWWYISTKKPLLLFTKSG